LPDETFKPQVEQEKRSETASADPWFDPVQSWLTRQIETSFSAADILSGAVAIPLERMDKRAERRLGAIMRHLGYSSRVARIGLKVARRWVRVGS
jgi:hypothetical protein